MFVLDNAYEAHTCLHDYLSQYWPMLNNKVGTWLSRLLLIISHTSSLEWWFNSNDGQFVDLFILWTWLWPCFYALTWYMYYYAHTTHLLIIRRIFLTVRWWSNIDLTDDASCMTIYKRLSTISQTVILVLLPKEGWHPTW